MANDKIIIKGAREHNLKNVSMTLPREKLIERLTREMKEAAKILEFEQAAILRDSIEKLRKGK